MNSVEEVVESIEAAGLAVTLGRNPMLLNIRTKWNGEQRFVFSPVLRRSDAIPVEVNVRDSDSRRCMVLMEARPTTMKQPAMVLFGEDERYFVTQVSSLATSVEDALARLAPSEVQAAGRRGLEVKRQGDWFFIPLTREQMPQKLDDWLTGAAPPFSLGDHHAQKGVRVGDDVFVRGDITHSEHRTLHLNGWHKAVRNLAARVFPSPGDGLAGGWIGASPTLVPRAFLPREEWLTRRRD